MKLKAEVINAIQGDVQLILKLAIALQCGQQWVGRLLKANKDNGPLTTAAALHVIMTELKLGQEQVLEDSVGALTG
jgi:hypothetical protein